MDFEDRLILLAILLFVVGVPVAAFLTAPSDEERAREIYEQQHPCINGATSTRSEKKKPRRGRRLVGAQNNHRRKCAA